MKKNIVTFLFFGDCIPEQEVKIDDNIKEMIAKADFSLMNLETPITDSTTAILKTGKNFKKRAIDLNPVINIGVDAFTLANNHIRDFGDEGVVDTIKACCKAKIKTLGAGKDILEAQQPLRLHINGIRLSILNYCEHEYSLATPTRAGANPFDIISAFYQIIKESKKSDAVIVIYHGGLEYFNYPTPAMVKEFKFLVDAGANAVIAHHSHFYSGMIYYKERPLIFGLGNFFAETSLKSLSKDLNIGLIAELSINRKVEINSKLIPTIQNTATKTVALLNGEEKDRVIKELNFLSNQITDDALFESVWQDYYSKAENREKALLLSCSRIEYQIRKRIPLLNQLKSKFKLLNLLNHMRCESHRNKAVAILEKIYGKN